MARDNQGFERSSYEAIYGMLETGNFAWIKKAT
jgi:hypothetical protein